MDKRKLNSLALHSLRAAVATCGQLPGIPVFSWLPGGRMSSSSLFADCKDEKDLHLLDEIVEGYPWALPSRTLTNMAWDGMMTSSSLSFEALQLGRQTWLYFEFNDSFDDALHFLAVAKTTSPVRAHEHFIREQFKSNDFLTCPPAEISCNFSRVLLAECLMVAANVAIENGWTTSKDFWGQVCEIIAHYDPNAPVLSKAHERKTSGTAVLMDAYLGAVLKS